MSSSPLHPLSRVLPRTPQGPMRSPARALGWFSIGLGVVELLMPRVLTRVVGLPGSPRLTRLFGLREIGVGVGLLMAKDPAPWLWGRVAGDALDIAAAASGLARTDKPKRAMASLLALGGVAYVDLKTAQAAVSAEKNFSDASRYDYSTRSGFPKPASDMRGAARVAAPKAADRPVQYSG